MSIKNMSLVIATLLVVYAIPADAQENLGDLISEYGYDWIIGKWAATDDDVANTYLGTNGSSTSTPLQWMSR